MDVPSGPQLAALCRRLGFDNLTTRTLVEHRSAWDEPTVGPAGEEARRVLRDAYDPACEPTLPAPPPSCPLLHAYVLLHLAAETIDRQEQAGIDPWVTEQTLWDIGNQVSLHSRIHGRPGLDKAAWLSHHVNDHLFQLGRLQFQRCWLTRDDLPVPAGSAYLDVHVPERGPLGLRACDESFARARSFFPRHFPADRPEWVACTSWLLDPQLADLLPGGSNIVAFQRRFEVARVHGPANSRVFEFVFLRPDLDVADPDLDTLTPRTRLEEALVGLYRDGGQIRSVTGIAPFAGVRT